MEGDISLQLPAGQLAPSEALRAKHEAARDDFAEAVLSGLARERRSIPCRFFYDAVGSELFEEITKLEEYYPTRAETALLETHRAEIARMVGAGRVLIEFGSGSSRKTSLLIGALAKVSAYIPIDIAAESLREAAGGCPSSTKASPSCRSLPTSPRHGTCPRPRRGAGSSASSRARPSAISATPRQMPSSPMPRDCSVKAAPFY